MTTFAQAYLYEPVVGFGKIKDSCEYIYIFDKPASLPRYLQHFCPPDGSIICDDAIGLKFSLDNI